MQVVTPGADLAQSGTDAEVIAGTRRDPALFGVIFNRHYPSVHAYALRRLGPDRAEDVAAQTFLVAFDRRQRFRADYDSARPWLFGIASNLIAMQHRAEVRHYRAMARAAPNAITATDAGTCHADRIVAVADAQAARGRLATALADLGAAERDVAVRHTHVGLHEPILPAGDGPDRPGHLG